MVLRWGHNKYCVPTDGVPTDAHGWIKLIHIYLIRLGVVFLQGVANRAVPKNMSRMNHLRVLFARRFPRC